MTQRRTLLILGIGCTLFVLLILLLFLFPGKQGGDTVPAVPSPTPDTGEIPSRPISQGTSDEFDLPSAGGKDEPLPEDEAVVVNQRFELRRRIPAKLGGFSVEYDIEKERFVVTLEAPYEDSKQQFQKWLSDNGFIRIPAQEFEYLTQ